MLRPSAVRLILPQRHFAIRRHIFLAIGKKMTVVLPPHVLIRRQFGQGLAEGFYTYASTSLWANSFIADYSGFLAAFDGLTPAFTIFLVTLVHRLVLVVPVNIYADKLISRRAHAVAVINKQIVEDVGRHYGVSPSVSQNGMWTLDTNDRLILRNAAELFRKTTFEFAKSNRLSMNRLICLKSCFFPIWMHFSMGLRWFLEGNMEVIPGFLWVANLGQPDPSLLLPLLFGALSFLNIWTHRWMYLMPVELRGSWSTKIVNCSLVIASCVAVRVMCDMPAMIPLFWCSVLTTGLVQTLVLRHPTVKGWLRIGSLPSDTRTPFRDLFRRRRQLTPMQTQL